MRDVRVSAGDGQWSKARTKATGDALAGAVELFLRRHVAPAELRSRAKEVRSIFLARAPNYVQRYALKSEVREGDELRASFEVEVNREGLLEELRTRGFSARTLARRPRVLVISSGAPDAVLAMASAQDVLEGEGFRVRKADGDSGKSAEDSKWLPVAKRLGCHVVCGISDSTPGVSASPARKREPKASPSEAAAESDKLWLRGWMTDVRTGQVVGRTQVTLDGGGTELDGARALAVTRAGREIAYGLLESLEQSGWVPGTETRTVQIQTTGLDRTGSLEEIEEELAGLTETRRVALWEVARRTATWRLEAIDSGLPWETILASLRLRRGAIDWRGLGSERSGEGLETLVTEWVDR